MPTSYREADNELWRKWKKSKSPQDASNLVDHLLPLVRSDIQRYSTNMSYPVVEAYAKDLILQACKKYDPNKGVALATFVKTYMLKLNQYGNTWRSPMKIPEHRAHKHSKFKRSFDDLSMNLDREPTISELADHLKWSKAEVTRFLNEIRGEYSEDRPFVSSYNPKASLEEDMIEYIYFDLTSQEKLLLEYTTGYGGKKKLSNKEIMQKLKINQNQLSYRRKLLADKIDRMLTE